MNSPPTAALPIAACPNRECPSGEVGWCTDEELGTGFYGCDCGYHGPEVHCIWQSGQKFNSAKAEALRLHNLLCAPAVQATADADEAREAAVNLVCNHLKQYSRELGGAGMVAEAQDYAHAADLVRCYFGDKK